MKAITRNLFTAFPFKHASCLLVLLATILATPLSAQTTSSARSVPSVTTKAVPQAQPNATTTGFSGGITSNDFQPLMDLVQSIIKPDTWQNNGGEGGIFDYPNGVFADARGVVTTAKIELGNDARISSFPARSGKSSKLRILSLNRIEAAIATASTTGEPISAELKNLAGMYRVEYVLIDTENDDILIAGPAGPWRMDTSGRKVNKDNGLPTLQLDDLMVCLGNAFHDDGKFGCTIVPKQSSLAAAQKFINTTKAMAMGRKWRQSLQQAVGKQDIVVHGVAADSGVAKTIVAADVLMKKIGMGIEPSIKEVPDYFQRVKADPTAAERQTLIRWWFTMANNSLVKDADDRLFKISGNSLKVLSENELMDQHGQRIHTGGSNSATAGFAKDFTEHFDALAEEFPELARLRNVFDLAIVANVVRQYDVRNQKRWQQRFYSANESSSLSRGDHSRYSLMSLKYETEIDSIMNFDSFTFSQAGRKMRTSIVGVSGGVEFDADAFFKQVKIKERSASDFPRQLQGRNFRIQQSQLSGNNDRWWRD